ncbi:MAG: hypothetical protein ACD_37C00288G0005 [uncultured bacterium]|nr:MAG: hypothetical protein ACD_37C00288G0005 [uncultured bacterium]
MNKDIEVLKLKINKLHGTANERSLYPLICEFIQNYSYKMLGGPYTATPEESLSVDDKNIGFPDITVRRNNGKLVGWWEIKLPSDSLGKDSFTEQFSKYKDSLENILFTNLQEWQLWQWDEDGKPKKVIETIFDITSFAIGEEKKLEDVMTKFFEGRPFEAKTPKQLALALAKKTRLLSRQVEESYNEEDKESDLVKLKTTFERTLIQDISVHQFSNMIAETLTYSLFLAFLEHIHRGNDSEITLSTAIEYLPTNVPVLKDLYELISKISKTIPVIYKATQNLIEQLESSDISRIYHKLIEHKPGEDPVIQFYEPFLKEYDPKEREARGVYYTPKPVVDYIVRGVDWILRNKFGKEKGLAEDSVQLLDPATGTGTFLMSAIQEIYQNTKKENSALGEEMVKQEFDNIVLNHVLKHFYGFELMIAPYAIAHLKLTLEIERMGFDFKLAQEDIEPDNDRFKVYLANTLDNPNQPLQDFFGFSSIPQESEQARIVKKNSPILAIVGNPPYSGNSQNNGDWIEKLLKDAYYNIDGVSLGEKNPKWLQDDYVKFFRFTEWKINKETRGVVGMITNHGYIDNPTFRGMRYHLMKTFDEIYIFNLHGNNLKKENAPDGSKDENVFNIKVGTAICFLIKYEKELKKKAVYYSEMWGTRTCKFNFLSEKTFNDIQWERIEPKSDLYLFNNKQPDDSYVSNKKINEIFPLNSIGFVTSKDDFLLEFDKNKLISRIEHFIKEPDTNKIKTVFNLSQSTEWISKHKEKFLKNKSWLNDITLCSYRPFDNRYVLYSDELIERSRKEVLQHMFQPNISLLCKRQSKQDFSYIFVSNLISESCVFESAYANNSVMPLYIYSNKSQNSLLGEIDKSANFDPNYIQDISDKTNLKYIPTQQGDLVNTFGPEDIFYYIYSILHSSSFRTKYANPLKSDFPRIPVTSNKTLFRILIGYGKELVNLHLLGKNPFDKTITIFDDNSKWGVTPKTTNTAEITTDWKVGEVRYDENENRVYINSNQYFDGVEKPVWEFKIGGYQVCDKWLKDRKKSERSLSTDDIKHYLKIFVALRETIRIMEEIDQAIQSWPIK